MNQDCNKSVVALLWFGDKVMLAPRRKKTWTGYYAAIGGKVDPGETLTEALCREIWEESKLFIWYPYLIPRDCYVYEDKTEKVFFFDSWMYPAKFNNAINTEPKKRGDWELFTKAEALKLQLIPRLAHLIKTADLAKIRQYCP